MHSFVSVPIKSQEAEDRMKERMKRWCMGACYGLIANHHRNDNHIEYGDHYLTNLDIIIEINVLKS